MIHDCYVIGNGRCRSRCLRGIAFVRVCSIVGVVNERHDWLTRTAALQPLSFALVAVEHPTPRLNCTADAHDVASLATVVKAHFIDRHLPLCMHAVRLINELSSPMRLLYLSWLRLTSYFHSHAWLLLWRLIINLYSAVARATTQRFTR